MAKLLKTAIFEAVADNPRARELVNQFYNEIELILSDKKFLTQLLPKQSMIYELIKNKINNLEVQENEEDL